MGSPAPPELGIFWFVQQPGTPPRLVGHGVAVADGERYGDYINHPGEHLRYWPHAKPYLPSVFHDHGHKDWPRGRVLYNTKTQAFEVYLNEQLRTLTFEAEIHAYFQLARGYDFLCVRSALIRGALQTSAGGPALRSAEGSERGFASCGRIAFAEPNRE